jgi:hypothetical protein
MLAAVHVMWVSAIPWAGWGYYGQPSAVLWKDQLFVAVTPQCVFGYPFTNPEDGMFPAAGFLYRGTFAPKAANVRYPIEHENPETGVTHARTQAKLDIRLDRILLFHGDHPFIFPMDAIPLLEKSELAFKLIKLRGYESFGHFTTEYFSNPFHLPEVDYHEGDMRLMPGPDKFLDWNLYWKRARYDVQIAGPKSVRLFNVAKGVLSISIEPDYLNNWYRDKKGNVAENLPKPPDRQLRTGKIPKDFTEKFAAYTVDKRDYLVTPNGKVYMAVPKGKADLEVTKVWDDPRRRIVGVVQDQANDAVYGWGFITDSAAPERFYVKFAPKPVAVAYKRTVPLWNDRSDAYLESYECARAFRKAEKK